VQLPGMPLQKEANMSINVDRARGALYGQAIGDALGIAGEFKGPKLLAAKYGTGPIEYERVSRQNGSTWEPGEWSDDTEQALCILDAWIEEGGDLSPDGVSLAKEFLRWAETNGKGMGNHTWNVLSSGMYSLDPIAIAKDVWERSGKNSAANGAVMRTSVVGILDPLDLARTETLAITAARVTHYDPRCVAGAVAVSTAIAALVSGMEVGTALLVGQHAGQKYDPEVAKYARMSLEDLDLAEGMEGSNAVRRPPIGYTYKCMGAGFWALRQAHSEVLADHYGQQPIKPLPVFREVLQRVILAGGDTDTNGAVAGAMMGAFFGFDGLPEDLVVGLHDREQLDRRLAALGY